MSNNKILHFVLCNLRCSSSSVFVDSIIVTKFKSLVISIRIHIPTSIKGVSVLSLCQQKALQNTTALVFFLATTSVYLLASNAAGLLLPALCAVRPKKFLLLARSVHSYSYHYKPVKSGMVTYITLQKIIIKQSCYNKYKT